MSNIKQIAAQRQLPACGHNRDQIIKEYASYNVPFTPKCEYFTQASRSIFSSLAQFAVSDDYSWAFIKRPPSGGFSEGYGFDYWVYLLGGELVAQTINSVYRNPAHNFSGKVGGARASRHMFGDAVDLKNVARTDDEYQQEACLANASCAKLRLGLSCDTSRSDAGASWIEPKSGPCGYGCVHAHWRDRDNGIYGQILPYAWREIK